MLNERFGPEHLAKEVRDKLDPRRNTVESHVPEVSMSSELNKVTEADIRPLLPEVDGTVLVLQRNAADDRELNSPDIGRIKPESCKEVKQKAESFFSDMIEKIDQGERDKIDFMIVAGDTTLKTPDGIVSTHKRAAETANIVLEGLKKVMSDNSISEDQIINNTAVANGGVIEVSGLRDLLIMEESNEFVELLKKEYGTGKEFWQAYEEDLKKEEREEMGAEGPSEIADRVRYTLSTLSNISKKYHKDNPGRRLVVWAVSHYDSISPYLKKHVHGVSTEDNYLPIEQGGGITIDVGKDGSANTEISGQTFQIN